MKKSLLLISIFVSVSLTAQIMPSPDAASLIKGINTPVNLYNGVASVSIPLYEATANNGAKVPVGLTYTGGGIKVNEISSVAGLGWQLSAGGSITRIVRDQPDEQAEFTTNLNYQTVRNVANGYRMYDFQKDIFFFQFPGGGGKFVFEADLFSLGNCEFLRRCLEGCNASFPPDVACIASCTAAYEDNDYAYKCDNNYSTEEIVVLPSSDMRIEFNYRGKLDSDFVITDTQGTKYYFGQTSASREKTVSNTKDNFHNTEYEDKDKREFISTWHLTKIEYVNVPADEGITFTYENATITTETEHTRVPARADLNLYAECMANKSAKENCDDCMEFNQEVDNPHSPLSVEHLRFVKHNKYYRNNITTFKSTIDTKLISSIRFTKGWINFAYGQRNDLRDGKRLLSVSMGHGATEVSKTTLDQYYFLASDAYFKGGTQQLLTEKGYRLKLNSVTRDGIPVAEFDYITDKDFHPNDADKYELPPRDSYYTDHWGYYNGGPHQGETYTWHGTETVNGTTIRGMKKGIREYAKANILTKVIYPTGGSKEFEYSNHTHHGGVKVDRVMEKDENGTLVSDISYTYDQEYVPDNFSYVENHVVTVPQDRNEITGQIIPHIFESSQTFVFDLNGPSNGYRVVTESNNITGAESVHEFVRTGDTGREIAYASKTFAVVDVYQDEFNHYPGRLVFNSGFPPTFSHYDPIDELAFPFSTPSIIYFDRGVEKKVTNYDENGVIVSEIENHYVHESETDFSVSNHSFHLEHLDEDVGTFQDNSLEYKYIVSKYDITSRHLRLDYSIARSYDDAGQSISETRTDYSYLNAYESLPYLVKTEVKDGSKVLQGTQTQTLYPINRADVPIKHSNSLLSEMETKNMIAVPLQVIKSYREPGSTEYKHTGNSITTFRKTHSLIVPYKSYVYPLSSPRDPGLTWYTSNFEELSSVTYNDQGLVETKNGQDGITTSYEYNDDGYITSMTIDPGVESLKRTTTYDYKPLVGLRSVTGPSGRKVSYVYDDQNRLLLTKDNDNNILKRYRYNVIGEEADGLSVSISTNSGYNLVGSSIGASAFISGSNYGQPQYSWNNGSTYSSTSYTFSTSGTKNIQVTVTDPEHPDLTTSETLPIEIYDSKIQLKINGPDYAEYCNGSGGDGGVFVGPDGGSSQEGAIYNGVDFFSYSFTSGGARCYSGYSLIKYQYGPSSSGPWTDFGGGENYAVLPDAAFDPYSSDYNIYVRVRVRDNCTGATLTKTKPMTVYACSDQGDGEGEGPGGGGGQTGWSLSITPVSTDLCPEGEPSSVNVQAMPGTLPGCSSGFTYQWKYKSVSASSWNDLLGTSSSISISRSLLAESPTNPYGSWFVEVTVSDGCGLTKTATARINVLFDCSSGEGIEGGGTGSEGEGEGGTGGGSGFDPGNGNL